MNWPRLPWKGLCSAAVPSPPSQAEALLLFGQGVTPGIVPVAPLPAVPPRAALSATDGCTFLEHVGENCEDLLSECQRTKHKRPVRGNCWVITIIYSLHFNFESYFFNDKGAGIISEPGEGRELGPPGAAAARGLAALRWRLEFPRPDRRAWHLSGSREASRPPSGRLKGWGHSAKGGLW